MFWQINKYWRRRHSALRIFTISLRLIFSLTLLFSESVSLPNWSKHSSDYDQLITEKSLRLATMRNATSDNDTHLRDDYESIKLNSTMSHHKSFYTLNNKEVVDITDQVYSNVSIESIRNISEQQFRNFLKGILQRHLELARRKIAYPNIFATTNNYVYQNNRIGCQMVCQFISFCIIVSGICLLWTCTCCTQSRSVDDSDESLCGVNPASVPAPIDYSKPYMIKCDSQGSCYASPLNDDEVPPLPSYNKALSCPTHPFPKIQELSKSDCV
ncbi:putative integral membrane protein [Brugia pahangi]